MLRHYIAYTMPILRIQWLNKCCWYLVDWTFIQIRRKIYKILENFNYRSKAKNWLHCADFHELVIAEGNDVAIQSTELQPTRSTSIENACSNSFSLLNKVFSLSRNSRYTDICSRTFLMNSYTKCHENPTSSLIADTVTCGRNRSPY